MKKAIIIWISGVALGVGVSLYLMNSNKNDVVISNDQVTISYKKVNNEIFDLLIEPKGDMNITSEFDLEQDVNYKDAYLVGISKDKSKSLNSNDSWNR